MKEYDFTAAKRNPYAAKLTTSITLGLPQDVLAYFERQSQETGIPRSTLIRLYLCECAKTGKKLA